MLNSTLNLEKDIRLLSNLSEEILANYYRASDAFVMPTQGAEAFGLSTIEAISVGLVGFFIKSKSSLVSKIGKLS